MSFLTSVESIGKNIWGFLQTPTGEGIVSFANPLAGSVLGWIVKLEVIFKDKAKSGVDKLAGVMQNIAQGFAIYKAAAALRGKDVTYDDAALQKAVNSGVQYMNDMKAFWGTVKEVELPKN